MKILFLCIITAALPLAAQTAEGDSTINRNITIEREYRPAIQDAGKINTLPHFVEPKVAKITPRYTTDFSKPLNVDQNIHYLSSAELSYQRQPNKEGFARVGVGTGFNSLADFAYPLLKKPDMKLDFMLNHYGLFNRKAHANTQAALAFDKQFKAVDLFAGVSGGHEYYKYYGETFDFLGYLSVLDMPAQNHLWRFNAYTGIQSSMTSDALRYGVQLNYDLFNSRQGVTEQQVKLNANIDGEVGGNRLGINISSQNQFYTTADQAPGYAPYDAPTPIFNNYYVLLFNPYYSMEWEAVDLRVGFKSSFSFAKGRTFSPSPDVHVEWRAVPRILSLYAGAGGGYKINTLNDIYKENCFLNPNTAVDDTYTPVDFYFGTKIKPVTGLLLDLYVDYSMINNQYFFINQEVIPDGLYLNRFDVVYSKANVLKVGGRISYNYHDRFNIRLSGAYNHWSVQTIAHPWHKPAWEMDLNTNVRITSKLNVYANMSLCGKRLAPVENVIVELKPKVDINLGASYAFLDWLSAFLKVNNLINNRYEQWNGYEVQGFNVMAGAAFNF